MKIIKKKEWDKDFIPKHNYTKHHPVRIVIHHSWKPEKSDYMGVETVRAIRRYHTNNKHWNDIGYHYIVSPTGRDIFEGRPDDVIGAHCGGKLPKGSVRNFGNLGSIGICLLGNYDKEPLDEEGVIQLMELIKMLSEKYRISLLEVKGHCHSATPPTKTCPGKNLFIRLFGGKPWDKLFGEK